MAETAAGFGRWLRARVAERRLTLAELSRSVGCDYTYLWRMIHSETARGRRYHRPSYQLTRRIGEALGAPEQALAAAGYASPASMPQARVVDRLAQVERELAELRRTLTAPERSDPLPPPGGEWDVRTLPVLGRIRAGEATDSPEVPDGWVEVPAFMAGSADYALRVRGDSMAPGLVEGDIVLLVRRDHAEPGEIVAVSLNSEITLKRLAVLDGVPHLVGDNEDWAPLPLAGQDPEARILGVVTGSYRPGEVLRRKPW